MSWPRYGGAAAGGGAGGSPGLAFGSITATTRHPDGRIDTITGADGLTWTYQYTGLVPVRRYTFGGEVYELSVDLTENAAGDYTEDPLGNCYTADGAIRATTAQVAAVRAGLTTAHSPQFEVPDLASSVDAAGVETFHPCTLRWDGYQIVAVNGVRKETRYQATHVNSAATSSALRSLALPAWLLGLTNTMRSYAWVKAVYAGSTASGSCRADQLVNGSNHAANTGGTATTTWTRSQVDIVQLAATSQMVSSGVMAGAGGVGSASTAATTQERAIDTTAGNITVGFAITTASYVATTNTSTGTFLHGSLELVPA